VGAAQAGIEPGLLYPVARRLHDRVQQPCCTTANERSLSRAAATFLDRLVDDLPNLAE